MSGERLIVVGLDHSQGAARALGWALRHAAGTGATVLVVTAYSAGTVHRPGELRGRYEDVVELQRSIVKAARADLAHPPRVSLEVIEDHPVRALVRAAREADLLVLGSEGRGPLGDVLFGSVSAGCIRHASTAVTVVPPTQPEPSRVELLARTTSG